MSTVARSYIACLLAIPVFSNYWDRQNWQKCMVLWLLAHLRNGQFALFDYFFQVLTASRS